MTNYRIVTSDEYTSKPRFELVYEREEESFLAQMIREILCPCTKKAKVEPKQKKVVRNEVDGSFVVSITDSRNFPELAQRLLDYAAKNGLTVDPKVSKTKVGEGLAFGSRLYRDYDVKKVTVHEAYKAELLPVYHLSEDFETILKAIKELAAEKETLNNQRLMDWATGKRAFLPTFSTLKSEVVGGKLIEKKISKSFDKGMDKEVRRLNQDIDRITVSQNFIKVGYDFIPINDNDLVYLSV